MKEIPIISFITVNYNGLKDTCELIHSLQHTIQSMSYEIIVVDNASKVNEAELIAKEFPQVIVLRSEQNLGFAGGNNKGISRASGRYLFFINNDTYLIGDNLCYLIERLNSHPSIGGVSPKIRFAAAPQFIQFAGFTPLSPVTLRNTSIGFGCTDNGQFNIPHPTPYLHGAAMMIKRETIEKAGRMPEAYFLYYEELDWSLSLSRAGYELWYEPRCTIFHKESQSTGQDSPLRTFYMTRNRLLFAKRNLSGSNRLFSIAYQLSVVIPKQLLTLAAKRKWKNIAATLQGTYAFIILSAKN